MKGSGLPSRWLEYNLISRTPFIHKRTTFSSYFKHFPRMISFTYHIHLMSNIIYHMVAFELKIIVKSKHLRTTDHFKLSWWIERRRDIIRNRWIQMKWCGYILHAKSKKNCHEIHQKWANIQMGTHYRSNIDNYWYHIHLILKNQ